MTASDVRERYGLNPGDVIMHFGAMPPQPPGYLVVCCESDEQYRWVMEGGDVWSDALPDKWTARRWAWAHHRACQQKPAKTEAPAR